MLEPPCVSDEGMQGSAGAYQIESERAAASIDEMMDQAQTDEERHAAMESEIMKRDAT